MRIASGVTDQYIYFVAVDATDFSTRETGLSSFTVYRSRNGGAAAAMTTPTINETDASNMPGVYELLLDEDMTIDSGDETQAMAFHVTHAGMAPVTLEIELYRPKITAGNTLDVTSGGEAGLDFNNVNLPAGAIPSLGIVDNGTAQSATSTTLVLRSAAAFADDELIGAFIQITGGSAGVGQTRIITDYDSATDTATVDAWTTTPTGTITYVVFGTPPPSTSAPIAANMTQISGDSTAADNAEAFFDGTGYAGTNNVIPTVSSVTAIAAGGITAASIATDAIDADALAADAIAEINATVDTAITEAALATAAALATVDANVDSMVAGIITGSAVTGTLTTSVATTDLTGYADDQLIGRIITWTSGDCEGEQTDITDYASASGTLTFTALTTAPGNGDTFKIT